MNTTNHCAKNCAFHRCTAPALLYRSPCCFHWRRNEVSRDGNNISRLIVKMASAETVETERGMTIFLDVSFKPIMKRIFPWTFLLSPLLTGLIFSRCCSTAFGQIYLCLLQLVPGTNLSVNLRLGSRALNFNCLSMFCSV